MVLLEEEEEGAWEEGDFQGQTRNAAMATEAAQRETGAAAARPPLRAEGIPGEAEAS